MNRPFEDTAQLLPIESRHPLFIIPCILFTVHGFFRFLLYFSLFCFTIFISYSFRRLPCFFIQFAGFPFFPIINHSASGFLSTCGFQEHAECILNRSHLVLRPLDASSLTLEAQILNDLIQAGYGGQYLLDSFRRALAFPR